MNNHLEIADRTRRPLLSGDETGEREIGRPNSAIAARQRLLKDPLGNL
jgi:hypothetical protein